MNRIFVFFLLAFTSVYSQASQGAWGLYDYTRDTYQVGENTDRVRSIASVTKLFTATTILRAGLDLNEKIKIKGRSGGRFSNGQMISRLDLLKAMLISSDNLAAESLANSYPGGFNKFIEDTNTWVQGWGLTDTTIVDASGLMSGNQSTVNNLITFIHKIKQYPEILSISAEANVVLKIPKGRKEIKIHLKNTNPEIFFYDNIVLSKTGTTNAAGKCVVMLVEKDGTLHGIVILGQRNTKERSLIAQTLLKLMPIATVYAGEEVTSIEILFP